MTETQIIVTILVGVLITGVFVWKNRRKGSGSTRGTSSGVGNKNQKK